MSYNDTQGLKFLQDTTGGMPYNPPLYTCIKEFTNNFPVKEKSAFVALPSATKSAWQPTAPYPRIYSRDYRKTVLSTLK
jgi:hypothetical protein